MFAHERNAEPVFTTSINNYKISVNLQVGNYPGIV